MAIRVNRSLVTSAADLQISSNSEKLQHVDFISFTTKSDEPVGIVIYSTTNDTSSFPNEKINLHQFSITSRTPKILLKEDFPIGDANEYLFGNDSSYNKLFVAVSSSEDVSDRVIVHYSVTDVSVSADYTTEMIQDIVGAMFTGNTETNITATYEDSDGTIDLVSVDTNTTYTEATSSAEGLMSTAHHDKLDGIAAGAEVNVNADWNSSSGDSQILNKPTIPAAYTDAEAVSAVAAADNYLKNDANDEVTGTLTVHESLFIQRADGTNTTKCKIRNNSTTSNRTLDVPDANGVIQVDVSGGFSLLKGTAKITLSTADCNALHTTPIELVAAQGANTVIIPTGGIIRVDRAASQTNSAVNLDFHYNGTTPGYSTTSLVHLRRFMYNETGDRVYALTTPAIEMGQNLTDDVNAALQVSASAALTNNCITSATIFLTYNIIDIS